MLCYEEFALKGYNSVSLTEIIKKLGLAKGSFYRYFSSKKELYAYLIHDASQRRLSKLNDLVQNPKVGFFKLIKQNFLDKIQFDLEYPVIGGFLFRVMHERDTSEISDIVKGMFGMVVEQTKAIIEMPKFNKKLAITDATMVAFQIFHTQLWLYDYIAFRYNINFEENVKGGLPIINIPKTEIEKIIDQAMAMLKNGIKAK
jgi:TetR/AcrR family transcriptional regulator